MGLAGSPLSDPRRAGTGWDGPGRAGSSEAGSQVATGSQLFDSRHTPYTMNREYYTYTRLLLLATLATDGYL